MYDSSTLLGYSQVINEPTNFSHKRKTVVHTALFFNQSPVAIEPLQKHLGLILDKNLISSII